MGRKNQHSVNTVAPLTASRRTHILVRVRLTRTALAIIAAVAGTSCANSAAPQPTALHRDQSATPAAATTPGWLHPQFEGRGDLDGDGQADRVQIRPHGSGHGSPYMARWVL